MRSPKKTKFRKVHRLSFEGKAKRGKNIDFGEYGLKALEGGWVTNRQIEAARIAMTRYMKRGGKLWIRIFPDHSKTKKGIGVRMGSGKGNPETWVAVVKKDVIMFEIGLVPWTIAKEALRLGSHKLSVKTRIVRKEDMI